MPNRITFILNLLVVKWKRCNSELDVGRVHPWVALGWFGSSFWSFGWIRLGWVTVYRSVERLRMNSQYLFHCIPSEYFWRKHLINSYCRVGGVHTSHTMGWVG